MADIRSVDVQGTVIDIRDSHLFGRIDKGTNFGDVIEGAAVSSVTTEGVIVQQNIASGPCAHVEGNSNQGLGTAVHVEGEYNISDGTEAQHIQGKYCPLHLFLYQYIKSEPS